MFLLDTNVVSELRRPKPHGAVVNWISSLGPESVNLAGASVGEIQSGIERTRENDPVKAVEIEGWLSDLIRTINVITMDADTFRLWARFMHKKPPHITGDAIIAATAAQHGLTISTRNIRDFEQFPVRLVNPFR